MTVINDNAYFQFTPTNPWVSVGWRKKKDITVDLAPVLAKQGIKFVHGKAKNCMPMAIALSCLNAMMLLIVI